MVVRRTISRSFRLYYAPLSREGTEDRTPAVVVCAYRKGWSLLWKSANKSGLPDSLFGGAKNLGPAVQATSRRS